MNQIKKGLLIAMIVVNTILVISTIVMVSKDGDVDWIIMCVVLSCSSIVSYLAFASKEGKA